MEGVSGALMATRTMQMQTFIKEPLRTQPLLFDNHAKGCRYDGPLEVAPTITATFGSGGNNIPMLVDDEVETAFCIASNTINRVDGNGGNGKGFSTEVSYTLLTSDIHAVYHHQPYQDKVGALCHRDHKWSTHFASQNCYAAAVFFGGEGVNTTYVTQDKCIVDNESENFPRQLVRRLTPLECERLQGFPDNWTNIEGASDSPRYKALGNSVAIPCVEFVTKGIASKILFNIFCVNYNIGNITV